MQVPNDTGTLQILLINVFVAKTTIYASLKQKEYYGYKDFREINVQNFLVQNLRVWVNTAISTTRFQWTYLSKFYKKKLHLNIVNRNWSNNKKAHLIDNITFYLHENLTSLIVV